MMQPDSLYVHIPFCSHICGYCDFAKVFYRPDWADQYLDCLEQELCQRQALRPFQTVYIGGGSPSALTADQLARLFDLLKTPLSEVKEATIEINPEDLTATKAALIKKAGINRVSLGVQTFADHLLSRLGRHHDIQTVRQAVRLLVQADIPRISFDLMYGLPGQTLENIQQDLKIMTSFPEVGHVSYYALILEEHTRFYLEKVSTQSDEWLLQAQQEIVKTLRENGFERYEVSNFAKPDQQSMHNLVYWHNQQYIGVGMGASGYVGQTRYENTRSLQQYLRHPLTAKTITLSQEDQMFEELMLGLRLTAGISLSAFTSRYGCSVMDVYGQTIQHFIEMQLLYLDQETLKTTPQGMDVLDSMLIELMA